MALALGVEDTDGAVRAIYVHSDGIAEHGGYTIARHYRTWEAAESLVSLGCLSWVGVSIGDRVDFDESQRSMIYAVPSQCLAYTRDRGEPWEENRPTQFKSRDEFRLWFAKGRAQYGYVFSRSSGKWHAVDL